MELRDERQDGILILAPSGRIDGSNSTDFESGVMKWIDDGNGSVLLDFEGVSYISSAGLRVILILARKLQEARGQFALCSMQTSVYGVFEVSGFTQIVSIHPTRQEAIEAMQAASA